MAPELTTTVNEQNEQAVGFYKKVGFKVTGRSEVDDLEMCIRDRATGISGSLRGANPSTARLIAAICCGVVPQQPPTILRLSLIHI